MYNQGNVMKQDHVVAAGWFLKAADQGHASAQYNLGVMYMLGEGIEHSNTKAAKWFNESGKLGDTRAMFNMG